jgi:hypothetical protein
VSTRQAKSERIDSIFYRIPVQSIPADPIGDRWPKVMAEPTNQQINANGEND